eukprot:gene4741-1741_t
MLEHRMELSRQPTPKQQGSTVSPWEFQQREICGACMRSLFETDLRQ